jgi:hypothetical protein
MKFEPAVAVDAVPVLFPSPHLAFRFVRLVALVPEGTPAPVNRLRAATFTASKLAG